MKQYFVGSYKRLKQTNILANFINLSSIQLSNALLLMLIYPIITHIIGIEAFGFVMLANTFSGLAGIAINYGTNQSGIRDIALNIKNPYRLRNVFYVTLWMRLFIFVLFILTVAAMQWLNIKYYTFIILAIPLVAAEVLNPLFFFTGTERLKLYNIANLISKVTIITLVIIVIKGPDDAKWVNLIMGTSACLTYLALLGYAVIHYKLKLLIPKKHEMLKIGKENFYLTINSVSVQLQQSLMVFALAKWGSPTWLGAYSLCDKIIWSSRIMIIAVSNAIYPKAAQFYQEGPKLWEAYMKRMKGLMAIVFSFGSLLLFIMPGFFIHLISGEHNEMASNFLRIMAFVPAVAALNSLNVVDLLLKNNTRSIFNISIILFIIACITCFLLIQSRSYHWLGLYTLIVECSALMMYEYVIKKSRNYAHHKLA
ncbi:oligosaccharide flippase family protein [Pedobacter sp. B4-66]|uniref:lipopolysaccharide biosynthesis protein n=1 Tax=Pedobacter sp. B4-66 TaxID=2817280 RepID=UPI001BD9F490|nr:oligosaccharide flippase family protein [Pedobacter sp. B4-66]